MITYLKGILTNKGEMPGGGAYFVVEVGGGVGFQVFTSMLSLVQSPALNAPVTLHTSLIVREDAMQMVGFMTKEERELFDILGTASGVGFKVALSLMSGLSVSELAAAIMTGDHKRLTAAKGVGPKLAQKISIELKEKMSKWREELVGQHHFEGHATEKLSSARAFQEAETVLLSLGYSILEIHQGLQALQQSGVEAEAMSSEEVLQRVLKWLATHPVQ